MPARPVHVVPRGEGDRHWAVRREGATRASSLHATKEEAVRAATVTAKRERAEVEVHTRDGKIAERNSYGHDRRDRGAKERPKRSMTGKELYPILLKNGLIGLWKDRVDIGDTLEFVQTLKDEVRDRKRSPLRTRARD